MSAKVLGLIAAAAMCASPTFAAQSVAGTTVSAAGGYSVCHEAALAYDDALKQMAKLDADGFLDDSAPRATMRAADATAWASAAQANLSLLAGARCPMPDLPVTRDVYREAAMRCRLATYKNADDIKTACATTDWKPGPRWLTAKRPSY